MKTEAPKQKRKRSGFEAPNAFVALYNIVRFGRIPEGQREIPPNQKIALLAQFKVVKNQYQCTQKDILHCIYFQYAHNPLKLGCLTGYGNSSYVMHSMKYFLQWKEANKDLIKQYGVRRAITKTVPRTTESDDYLSSMMDDLLTTENVD